MAAYDKRDIVKAETMVTVHFENAGLNLERKRAAIKAALRAATAGLAATAVKQMSALDDGGTPPWGEVIIGPIWGERNPPEPPAPRPEIVQEADDTGFWKW
jgi:hypothetical protein